MSLAAPATAVSDRWTGVTIAAALDRAVDRYGEAEAFVFPNARVTYAQLAERSEAVARAFIAGGVQRGDRVAIWMAGFAEWADLYFGLTRIGAIMVPVNTRYRTNELEYVLRKSGASVLVFRQETAGDKDYAAMLRELQARADLPELTRVVALSGTPASESWQAYDDFLASGLTVDSARLAAHCAAVRSDDTAIVQFTSGTTAFPKGAELFQESMLRGCAVNTAAMELSASDRFFSPQPFYHAGGSVMVMLCPIVTGCPVIVQAYFDAADALRTMGREACTATMGHQPHWIEYLNHPDLQACQLRLTRAMVFASPDVNRMVHDRLGIEVMSPYGMTETHLGGTACPLSDPLEARLTTVGRPYEGLEMELRDLETGRPVAAGERGEVYFRGPLLMKGYYRDPERTAEAIDRQGWFRTGDLGIIGDDGNLRLIGRVKDMVRVGGENVAAAEVEGYLLKHTSVKQAVLVGRPDARLGEVGVAFVELKANATATESELIDYCRQGLASFKVPRAVNFLTEWPMSGTGKIQKFLLVEAAWTAEG